MKVFFVICVLALMLMSANSAPNNFQYDPFWDSKSHHCGHKLAEELALICAGKYNELPAGVSQSIIHRRQMGIPLITEECCEYPCSRRTLKMYCAPSQQ